MPRWELVGTRIPKPVVKSAFLRAVALTDVKRGIRWAKLSRRPSDWSDFHGKGRALIVIHGTGQRVRDGFRGLTPADFKRLTGRYEGRILAFEHPAVRNRLDRNVYDLLRLIPPALQLSVDIIGISRGGLIARYLAEGWAAGFPQVEQLQIRRLLFVGTPNAGTPSARRGRLGLDWGVMTAWRSDVRRVGLVSMDDRAVEQLVNPMTLGGLPLTGEAFPRWPVLHGTADQVPGSPVLTLLNGFARAAPSAPPQARYYAVASSFNFEHGVPNPQIIRGRSPLRRAEVMAKVVAVPNDLVVPTRAVYDPPQGPFSSGLFPIAPERLMVLAPSSNVTHVGFFRSAAVRHQIIAWLEAD